jgi:CheY-like chemotaxis protein
MTARLAVVDDDKAFAEFTRTLLQTRGYAVDTFNSGTDLMESLRGGSQPNLVLLDVMMPDVDGLETLRAIPPQSDRASHHAIGRQVPSTIVEAIRLGAADYVSSPLAEGVGGRRSGRGRNALERQSPALKSARRPVRRNDGRSRAGRPRPDAGRAGDGRLRPTAT